ncbi:MAG: ATP-binding cassette domain-containing protein [Candidatus Sumerlaeia bacterium]|nr:ATP-binding cassette domain-containing protein [Candidatus Sumerlaeia bacterium]
MIELIDIHKSFGSKHVLRGVSLQVEKGENHVVVGRSGEGKSVLLKQVIGLMKPDSGDVIVGGYHLNKDPKALQWVRRKVAMVFQMAALFDSLTVYENVAFYWLENKQKTRGELDRLVPEILELVDLPNTEHLYPAELSGGMRKRVGLARALACDPEILLYDEPTTGLDPVTSEVINELMVRASHARNVTSVVITHDMRSAYTVGHRISMLYEGNIIFTGTPKDVQNSRDPVVNQFVNGLAEGPMTQIEDEEVQRTSKSLEKIRLKGRLSEEDVESA